MTVDFGFQSWGLGFSGCDGGNIGTPEKPSTWVCGIERGGGYTPEGLISHIGENVEIPPEGYDNWEENIAYIFNWQVMKLLSAIHGHDVSYYKKFAETVKPFIRGQEGYFKMNLYPISFKNTSHDKWLKQFSEKTGFESKSDYLNWCSEFRFPEIRKWTEKYAPKLIICLGKTYIDDFKACFLEKQSEFSHEVIDERDLFWSYNKEGGLIVVIPFMVNRNGLVKNVSIQKFGERISHLLQK